MVMAFVTHDAVIRPILWHIDPGIGAVAARVGTYQVVERMDAVRRVAAINRTPQAD